MCLEKVVYFFILVALASSLGKKRRSETEAENISSERAWWKSEDEEDGNLKESQMSLLQFSNKSITCNDGTTAGYYIRKSPYRSNNLWIVFLEGGWYCFNEKSCQNRWMRLRNLMTSSSWPQHKHVGGILSGDPIENPYWSTAHHIFVPYCSSDSWSGTVSSSNLRANFSFMGAIIVKEVIQNLIKLHGFNSHSSLILAGSSAGGTGVMLNLDSVSSLINSHFVSFKSSRVRGITDSGWFLDSFPSQNVQNFECNDVLLCPPLVSLKEGLKIWNSQLPISCAQNYAHEPWSCFFGYRIYPTLKSDLFVFQWLFDEAQMVVSNVLTPAFRKEEWDTAYKLGDELKKSLENVTSLMVPSCISHTVLTHRDWKHVEVNGVYLPKALKCWESNGIVHESNLIPSRIRSSSEFYWADLDSLTINSNDSSAHNRRKVHRRRHQHHNSSLLTKRRRRRRRKHNSKNGNTQKILTLPPSLTQSPPHASEISLTSKTSTLDNSLATKILNSDNYVRNKSRVESNLVNNLENNNRNFKVGDSLRVGLVTNLDNNNSNKRRLVHNLEIVDDLNEPSSNLRNNNVQGLDSHSSNSNSYNFHNSHQPKVPESNNNRNSFTYHNKYEEDEVFDDDERSRNRLRKRRRRRQRRFFNLCENDENILINKRHVEKCAWPQCNKSCPKLLNPHTGEEVDFKDLLKSFGLDLIELSKALGIDLTTLNNMDHMVLLQMLTQHS